MADTYPLYSGADDALFELGGAYEKEVELVRRSKLPETAKGRADQAVHRQARCRLRPHPHSLSAGARAADAKKRLEAMKQPVPKATPEAIAADKKEIASRGQMGIYGKVMENFHQADRMFPKRPRWASRRWWIPSRPARRKWCGSANASVSSLLPGGNNT